MPTPVKSFINIARKYGNITPRNDSDLISFFKYNLSTLSEDDLLDIYDELLGTDGLKNDCVEFESQFKYKYNSVRTNTNVELAIQDSSTENLMKSWKDNNQTTIVYNTGSRKTSVAKVWVKKGNGLYIVNKKIAKDYFSTESNYRKAISPISLELLDYDIDVRVTVSGGGTSGQAGAMCHGLSKSIAQIEPSTRPILKAARLLTRDPRMKERKKYGKKGARASFQFSKR